MKRVNPWTTTYRATIFVLMWWKRVNKDVGQMIARRVYVPPDIFDGYCLIHEADALTCSSEFDTWFSAASKIDYKPCKNCMYPVKKRVGPELSVYHIPWDAQEWMEQQDAIYDDIIYTCDFCKTKGR